MIRVFAVLLMLGAVAGCGGSTGPAPVEHADIANSGAVTVRRGDSAWLIARREGVPLKALIQANGLRPPYLLEVGQRLRVPRLRLHRVRAGESISIIAERYRVSRFELAQVNRIGPPYRIYPNQVLKLPGSAPSRPARRVAVANVPPLPPARPAEGRVASRSEPTTTANAGQSTTPAKSQTRPRPAPRVAASTPRKMIWPVAGRVISGFGAKPGGLHNDGVNIAALPGTDVKAAAAGTIVYAGNELRGFGNLVLIRHGDGLTTAYAHLQRTLVDRGQKVAKGARIATVGDSGGVQPAQLHFEIRKGRKALNPLKQLGPVPTGAEPARVSLAECDSVLPKSSCRVAGERNG